MKRLLLLLALFISPIAWAGNDDAPKTREEIQLIDILTPAQPDQMRSQTKYAEGWIDYQMACIEVQINEVIGTTSIVIVDAYGRTVATATINPEVTTFAILPMPAQGTYTMGIASANYYGESNFTID
ncbi:MAG: hypothetical protein E7148_07960 [Rikenellaceae bacterium]|nr:hypothetical protein [Rikenellaceae bacterium]